MIDLSFLFLNVDFEFGAEIFGRCTNIPCEHPQFFVEFVDTFKNVFLSGSIGSTLRGGSTRYFLSRRRFSIAM